VIDPTLAEQTLNTIASSNLSGASLRKFAMEQLSALPNYNWSGIYRLEGDTLVLDEYVGAETDHTHIPVGRGVCGTAVADNANQIVEDVNQLTNYLACSITTKSEIVVLIRDSAGTIFGQIDIDGHTVGAFDQTDESFLDRLAVLLAPRWND
jgi:GAF domain-containing protein